MSEQNVEAMRAVYEAVGRKDIDGMLKLLPLEFEWDNSRSISDQPGIFRGHDQVRGFIEALTEAFSVFEPFETEIIEAGDVLVRVGGFRARGKVSGAEVSATGATVWTFSDDRPVSARLYQNKAEALEAARLSG